MNAARDVRRTARVRPFASAGEVLALPDGSSFVVVPIALFRSSGGMTVFRVGATTYWFDEIGNYDGVEICATEALDFEALRVALNASRANRRRVPDSTYFDGDTPGGEAELALYRACASTEVGVAVDSPFVEVDLRRRAAARCRGCGAVVEIARVGDEAVDAVRARLKGWALDGAWSDESFDVFDVVVDAECPSCFARPRAVP